MSRCERTVWWLTALHAGYYGLVGALNLATFGSSIDFAGAYQGMWQLAFGQDQFNTVFGAHNFVNHVYGANVIIAPLFRLWPSCHLLQSLQVLAIALGAPVVFRLTRDRTDSELLGATMSVAYLLSPTVVHLSRGDYYGLFPLATLLLLTFYQLGRSRWLTLLCGALALMCQENVAPTLFLLGLYAALRIDRRTGFGLMAMSLLWFAFVIGWLIPTLNDGHPTPHLAVYAIYGKTPGEIIVTVLTRPGFVLKQMLLNHSGLAYLHQANAMVGFLSLLAPEVLLIDSPDLMANLMTTYKGPHTFGRHYGLMGLAIWFYAAAIGLQRARGLTLRWRKPMGGGADPVRIERGLLLWILTLAVSFNLAWSPLPGREAWALLGKMSDKEIVEKREVCRSIPDHVGISAPPELLLHLSPRGIAYAYPNPWLRSGWDGRPGDPDYGKYIVSAELAHNLTRGEDVAMVIAPNVEPPSSEQPEDLVTELQSTGQFRAVKRTRNYVVLKRVAGPPTR